MFTSFVKLYQKLKQKIKAPQTGFNLVNTMYYAQPMEDGVDGFLGVACWMSCPSKFQRSRGMILELVIFHY